MAGNIIIWFGFILANALIAYLNNVERVDHIHNSDTSQVNHPLWGFIYSILVFGEWFFNDKNYFIAVSILLQHISFFPVIYNLITDVPVFNLSKTSSALTDKLMVKIGLKNTAIVNISFGLISFILLILSIILP